MNLLARMRRWINTRCERILVKEIIRRQRQVNSDPVIMPFWFKPLSKIEFMTRGPSDNADQLEVGQ